MEIIKCSNGHSYDPSITPECPECAKLRGKTVPLTDEAKNFSATENYRKTVPVVPDQTGEAEAIRRRTKPVNPKPDAHWADAKDYMDADYASESYAPTMPIIHGMDGEHAKKVLLPVTGWLVCIEGASKGQDYRIHAEYNYIGRSSKMDICIQGDPTISRENHAIIAYDTLEGAFYFAPSGGGSIVRVNGKAVLVSVELKAYDRLTIGQSSFLFVPFCGEQFKWGE